MYLHYDTKLAYNQHMKFLLAAINAKFIHSNPAVYSLRACVAVLCGTGRVYDQRISGDDTGGNLETSAGCHRFFLLYLELEAGAGDIGRASEDPATDRDLAGRTGSHL